MFSVLLGMKPSDVTIEIMDNISQSNIFIPIRSNLADPGSLELCMLGKGVSRALSVRTTSANGQECWIRITRHGRGGALKKGRWSH